MTLPAAGGRSRELPPYVLITPCRNESRYIRRTLDSVIEQTVRPGLWVIVDDGSTDDTAEIVKDYARRYPFIRLARHPDRGYRAVGAGVVEAFYTGLQTIDLSEFAFVGKLDGDLVMPPRYFESLLERFAADPSLGAFSGKVFLENEGVLIPERMGDENAIGAAKFYRRECFEEIGGFPSQLGWDGIDGHRCRMKGWITGSVDHPELRIIHLRQMGSSQTSLWSGRQRWGLGKWCMGSAWYYVIAVAFYRMFERPFLIGGIGIGWGYFKGMLTGVPRYGDRDFRGFLRRYELRSLLTGKSRTTRAYNREIRLRRETSGQAPLAGGIS